MYNIKSPTYSNCEVEYIDALERIDELEHMIEVIVMERTTYIELSFAEIQRLRVELNTTKQLLEEINQITEYLIVVDKIGPLKGIMNITTIYGNGTIVTRIVDVYQKSGGNVTTTWGR